MSVEWVALAHMLRPQGRRGEVLAELLTDFPEGLVGRKQLYVAREGFAGPADEARPCLVTDSWMPKGRNEGRIVLALEGVDTIEAAETMAGFDLLVAAEDRAPLEDGAVYISDLTGCSLFDGERLVGVVEGVEFLTSPDGRRRLEQASPLLVVALEGNADEAMIPFTRALLEEFDPVAKTIRMKLPEGLVELSALAGAAGGAEDGVVED